MKIGIDAYPLARVTPGIGRYLFNLLSAITEIDKKNEYICYLPSPPLVKLEGSNISFRITEGPLAKSSTLWMQYCAKKALLRDQIDIFWATQGILALNLPCQVKTVLTIHDLAWKYYPQSLKWDNLIIFPLFFKRSLKKVNRIITVSEATAKDLRKFFPESSEKISTVYSGVSDRGFLGDNKGIDSKKSIFSRLKTTPNNYILAVSTIEPRKNIENLLRAYFLLKQKEGFDFQLLIAGQKGWKAGKVYKLYKRLGFNQAEVKFTGYVCDRDLIELYKNAKAFVVVSLLEGFGFPPLEAMASGTPVVASSIPVFKEILGEAALLVDPLDPSEIAEGISLLLKDDRLRKEYIEKGHKRAQSFSWKNSAEKMLEVFNSL